MKSFEMISAHHLQHYNRHVRILKFGKVMHIAMKSWFHVVHGLLSHSLIALGNFQTQRSLHYLTIEHEKLP
jgi:hypothetical protein